MTYDYSDIPIGHYDRIYARQAGVRSKWHHMKFARFAEAMRGYCRHLDLGCGPGTFIGTLPEGRHDSVGLDIAREQLDYARRTYPGAGRRFLPIQGDSIPFEDDSFDVVTMIELIEHLTPETGLALLREARRVLRPGGRLLVSTPNYRSAWPVIEKIVNAVGDVDYTDKHITFYHRRRLADLMDRAGFRDAAVSGYLLAAPFVAAFSWSVADAVARLEPEAVCDRLGLLLFAMGMKHVG